jgi:CRP-like cAMP-binding protein
MEKKIFNFISKYISLTEEEEKEFIKINTFKSYKKGSFLLKEGEITNKSYFILKGCIRIFYLLDGVEKTTEFYTELEGINPHCVVDKMPSKYYINCIEDCIVSEGDPEMEAIMFEKFPKFEILFRKLTDELFIKQQISIDEFKIASPEQRYLNLIQNRPDLIQRVPQHQLASYLGITPVSLSRLRSRILKKTKI